MSWVIYYDGRQIDSDLHRPWDAPAFGVQAILHDDQENGPQILSGRDWYWWARGQWWAGDLHGYLDQAMHLSARWPKQGRTVHDAEHEAALARAIADRRRWADG